MCDGEDWAGKWSVKGAITGAQGQGVSAPSSLFLFPSTVLQEQLLKHKKLDIVDSLSVLPKTQHDFSSFFMDMWLQMVSTCFFPGTGSES